MPASSGSLAFLGAARFQGFWDATAANLASGSGLDELAAAHEAIASGGLIYGLFASGASPSNGYNPDFGLSAAIGDYWQVTGAGNFNVDGANSWDLNDWCIYSGTVGGSGGKWTKLAYQDTIASILVGGGIGGSVTAVNNKAADRLVTIGSTTTELDGEANLTFNSANLLTVTGDVTASVNISGSGFYGDTAFVNNVMGPTDGTLTIKSDEHINIELDKDNTSSGMFRVYDGSGTVIFSISAATGDVIIPKDLTINGSDLNFGSTGGAVDIVVADYAAGQPGVDLRVTAGAAAAGSGTPNRAGGDLVLSAGASTGTNTSTIEFKTSTAGSSGTSANAPAERMRVHTDGNIGIATNSPEHTLSVTGTLGISGDTSVSGALYTTNIRTNNTDPLSITSTNNDIILSSSSEIYILANDSIFLDLDNDNDDTSSAFYIRNGTNAPIFFVAESTGLAYAAQLGVGTMAAEHTLSVTGTLGVSGDTTVSGTLYATNIDLSAQLSDVILKDNTIAALEFKEASNEYLTFSTYNGKERVLFDENVQIKDDVKLLVGGAALTHEAEIFYNEAGDDFMVISGSAKGIAISGSTVDVDGRIAIGRQSTGTTGLPEHTLSVTGTLGVSGDTTISGSSYIGGNITGSQFYGGNIYNKDAPTTFIDFETANNQINFMAGDTIIATALGFGAKNFKVNTMFEDVDFIVHGDNTSNLIYANAGLDKVGIATNSPEHMLSVTGTLGVSGDTTISGSSYIGGNLGVGDLNPLTKFSVVANSANNTAMFVRNDGNDPNRMGVFISCGKDAPASNSDIVWLVLADGDSDGSSGLVSRIRYDTGGAGAVLESASDKRIKTEIKPTKVNALEILNNMPLSEFKMAKKDKPIGDLNRIGFVAQDCEKVWPEMVSEMEDSDYDHKIKTIAPSTLIPVLVKAIQELSAEVEALKKK